MNWNQIETAPRDGTAILAKWNCVYAGKIIAVIYWDDKPEDEYGSTLEPGWFFELSGADNNQVREPIYVPMYSKSSAIQWVELPE